MAMTVNIGSACMALIGLLGASITMAARPAAQAMPVQCSATGAKLLAPAMTAAEACARFVRALSGATGKPATLAAAAPADGLVVELRFLPRGMASARATRLRAGRAQALPLYELAVSDRKFAPRDIDTLAASVAQGVTMAAATKG